MDKSMHRIMGSADIQAQIQTEKQEELGGKGGSFVDENKCY